MRLNYAIDIPFAQIIEETDLIILLYDTDFFTTVDP